MVADCRNNCPGKGVNAAYSVLKDTVGTSCTVPPRLTFRNFMFYPQKEFVRVDLGTNRDCFTIQH